MILSPQHRFINKARNIHGDKYDYSKVAYKNNRTYIEIVCPVHGSFYQIPCNHYRYGCNQCAYEMRSVKQMKSLDDFIKEAENIHTCKYTYESAVYSGAHKKICITCPTHGRFEQSPRSHLNGRGCPACKQGTNHPRFGKPNMTARYCGRYHGNMFRSLSELFWMLSAERDGIEYLGLDQSDRRSEWQVPVNNIDGKPSTYCPDFYVVKDHEVIDIKPKWRMDRDKFRLDQARSQFYGRGMGFRLLDVDAIKVDKNIVRRMYDNGDVFMYPSSLRRLKS